MAANMSDKLQKIFAQKSEGNSSLFTTDVTGVLVKLESPSETGRPDTWIYTDDEGNDHERPTSWWARVKEVKEVNGQLVWTGRTLIFNWSGRIDDDGDNVPGINIIQQGLSVNDLLAGAVCRFRRDPRSRRSSVVPIRRSQAQQQQQQQPQPQPMTVVPEVGTSPYMGEPQYGAPSYDDAMPF